MTNYDEMEGGYSEHNCECGECGETEVYLGNNLWHCDSCNRHTDEFGEEVYFGMDDFAERQFERQQMGFPNF